MPEQDRDADRDAGDEGGAAVGVCRDVVQCMDGDQAGADRRKQRNAVVAQVDQQAEHQHRGGCGERAATEPLHDQEGQSDDRRLDRRIEAAPDQCALAEQPKEGRFDVEPGRPVQGPEVAVRHVAAQHAVGAEQQEALVVRSDAGVHPQPLRDQREADQCGQQQAIGGARHRPTPSRATGSGAALRAAGRDRVAGIMGIGMACTLCEAPPRRPRRAFVQGLQSPIGRCRG